MNKPVNKYTALAQQINEHFGGNGDEHDVEYLTQQIERLGKLAQQVVESFDDRGSENIDDMILQRIFSDALDATPKKVFENISTENDDAIEKKLTKTEIGAINFAIEGTDENGQIVFDGKRIFKRDDYDRLSNTVISVRNREHLDVLIEYVLKSAQTEARWILLSEVPKISENVVDLGVTIDLNFLDVSKVTDMSGLFKDFDVSPHPEKGWFCKIHLDISKWNVSNVTKMSQMFDCKNVDFGDLSKWDRSRVTDC